MQCFGRDVRETTTLGTCQHLEEREECRGTGSRRQGAQLQTGGGGRRCTAGGATQLVVTRGGVGGGGGGGRRSRIRGEGGGGGREGREVGRKESGNVSE